YAALRVALPDDQPAHAGVARPLDVAVRDRKHGRAAGREDVDALVRARTAVARVAEHAAYVGQAAAGDRKQQRRGAIHDHVVFAAPSDPRLEPDDELAGRARHERERMVGPPLRLRRPQHTAAEILEDI